jgi:hypothetical protein
MSQPKHSPGPFIALKYPDAKLWTVANSKGSVASKVKTEADAKLFAASTDLLAACKAVVEQYGWISEEKRKGTKDIMRAAVDACEKAIRRAEGGL